MLNCFFFFSFTAMKRIAWRSFWTVLNSRRCRRRRRRQTSHHIFKSHYVECIWKKDLLVFFLVVDTYSRCVFSKLIHSGLWCIFLFCSHISISMHLNSVSKMHTTNKKECACANKWDTKLQLNELLGKFVIFPIFIIGFTVFRSLSLSLLFGKGSLFSFQPFIMAWIEKKMYE